MTTLYCHLNKVNSLFRILFWVEKDIYECCGGKILWLKNVPKMNYRTKSEPKVCLFSLKWWQFGSKRGNYVGVPPKPRLRLAKYENSLFFIYFFYFSKSSVSGNARWQKTTIFRNKVQFSSILIWDEEGSRKGGSRNLPIIGLRDHQRQRYQ